MKSTGEEARDTVFTVMDRNKGAGPGFDWVRIGLSLMVVLLHSFHTSYGYRPNQSIADTPAGPLFGAILPMFFSLSGFLVAGSALRIRSLKIFLCFRALRIIPALAVEVTLSALILGALLTEFSWSEYFTDRQFFAYFGNIVGLVQFHLPGVFLDNPRPGIVNQNLFTLHPEIISYGVMSMLMLTYLIYNKRFLTIIWIIATIFLYFVNLKYGIFEHHGTYPGRSLIYIFFTGVVAFHWRDKVQINKNYFCFSLLLIYVFYKYEISFIIIQFPIIYAMLWLGMQNFPRVDFIQSGDYSYGIYLYAYPIQQTLASQFLWSREWYINFLISVPIAFGVAMVSWHIVERPALRLKRYFT